MTALAEALLAAQRQAVGALSKAYVAGNIDSEYIAEELDRIGLRDEVDRGLLLAALEIVKRFGGEAPKPTGYSPKREMPDPPTNAQRKYIAKLCDERAVPEPDVIVSKEQASEIIEALKAGTYNADSYSIPF